MTREVVLPELAESIVEGEILKWLVQEGEPVALEQPLCEVMTDKVTVELPSPVAGVLKRQLVQEGQVVAVHAPIALIEDAAAAAPSAPAQTAAPAPAPAAPSGLPTASGTPVQVLEAPPAANGDEGSLFRAFASDEKVQVAGLRAPAELAGQQAGQPAQPLPPEGQGRGTQRVLAVPAARQLARELGLDIAQVAGQGPNGRVSVMDVHRHAQARSAPATDAPAARSAPGLGVAPVQYRTPKGYEERERREPLRGLRRAISTQMTASHLYTVRTLTVDEVNLTRLVDLRARLNAGAAPEDPRLSYLPFIFKAVVAALRLYPSLNTSLDEATQEVVHKSYYNLGMAVATDAGLVVPVIRDADRRSVLDLSRTVTDLASRARTGKLAADELAGSTFSITNIGSVGALFSFPIINVPDAAILGVHSIVKRPVFDEHDRVVPAHMMYLSLSFDHRLVDGAEAARFCREVIRLLEDPERLLVSV
ncbi:dihydrolipoamide acetyltransferase family protein [Deinococcus sonorensis]|uniref:Dihydrolipoamide acetyltransferase component of pyruvate dehydrogenase complex n=2 Tax=Deinococcus sonorensis TaxID=309891 RepID=A0AAU7UCV2_9DEIO